MIRVGVTMTSPSRQTHTLRRSVLYRLLFWLTVCPMVTFLDNDDDTLDALD